MQMIAITFFVFVSLMGASLFVYGEYDDSPGGQLLGLVIVVGAIVGMIQSRKHFR